MIRRTAALGALLAFALAWIVGVWCGHLPATRIRGALIAMAFGAVAGALIGVALERIVLGRLAEKWDGEESGAAPKSPGKTTPTAVDATQELRS